MGAHLRTGPRSASGLRARAPLADGARGDERAGARHLAHHLVLAPARHAAPVDVHPGCGVAARRPPAVADERVARVLFGSDGPTSHAGRLLDRRHLGPPHAPYAHANLKSLRCGYGPRPTSVVSPWLHDQPDASDHNL